MRKWLQVIAAALILAVPAGWVLADLNVTEGSGKVLFGFTCFTTKECRTATLVNSAGTEIGTAAAPAEVNLRSATVGLAVTNAGTFATQAAQSGTWTNTVTQGTAANLNATVVGTGTFVTQSTLAAETTKVIGTTRTLGSVGGIVDAATGAAVPANGWYVGMNQGGNLTGLTGTSGNLNVQCANCSGSGVSTVDAATFTASTSLFAGTGGFFQTTATANALTNGQQGMVQMTANRALFANLRNASGTEIGTTTTPIVNAGNVASGATDSGNPVKVGGKYNSTPITLTDGQRGDAQLDVNGYWKVNVASATGLTQGSTTSGQTGSLVMGAVTTSAPTYTTAQTSPLSLDTAGNLRVNVVAGGGAGGTSSTFGAAFPATGTAIGVSDGTNMIGLRAGTAGTAAPTVLTVQGVASMTKLLVTPDSVALPANQSVNVAQINGVTTLMGNGTTGTGSQRVTIASDNTAFSVNAASTLAAETTKVIGTTRNLGNAGAIFDGATGAAPPANVVYAGAVTSGATGGLLSGIVACDSHALLNMTTATTTEIVALTASQSIYVCSILISSNGTTTATVQRGTGTNCGTGTAAITAGHELTAQVGYARGSGLGTIMRGTASNALCITNSAGVNLHIDVTYAKF